MSPARTFRLFLLAVCLGPLAGCGAKDKPVAPTGKDALDFYREQIKRDADRKAATAR